jgi:hypothetical protein
MCTKYRFLPKRYDMSEFLTSVLAKVAFMLLQALIMRLVQSLVMAGLRPMDLQSA